MPPKMSRRIEYQDIESVARAETNPKTHDLTLLEDSVVRFGYIEPIVLDERTMRLVAGHGRLDTLMEMKRRGLVPPEGVDVANGVWRVPVIRGWESKDDKEAQAYLLASNRITERGGWDRRALVDVLQGLDDDLAGVGFDQTDLDDLLAKLQEAQEVSHQNQRSGGAESHDESTYNEWEDRYVDKGVRSLVLDYPVVEYERVVALAGKARASLGVDNNAGLFAVLLERELAEP